uniref:Annexin n=1 Tax=Salmo trutta TaxID=8032 RepID=A0A674CHS9_SALTR
METVASAVEMETDITPGKMEVTSQMFGKLKPVYYGTVAQYPHLSASGDAAALEKAIEAKLDEDVTTTVLVKRSNGQKQQIKIVYEQSSGHMSHNIALTDDLNSALKDVVLDILVEILASRSNEEIRQIKRTFMDKYQKDLDKVIKCETSGNFTPAILALLKADRSEDSDVDIDLAKNGARALFEAGENTKGTDVAVFIDIPAAGFPQLAKAFQKYSDFSDVALPKALDLELKIEDCLIDIGEIISTIMIDTLHKTPLQGYGTCDETLIRVLLSRSEVDLKKVIEEFETMYKRTLQQHTLGYYEKIQLLLCGPL